MASTQQKSERAEAAAKDIEQVNREKEFDGAAADPNQKRGVIGSVLSAVRDTYQNAKEAVVGKRDPTAPDPVEVTRVVDDDVDVARTGEVRDISAGKSSGIYDSTKDATGRAGLKVGEYAKEAKDKTVEKTGEYAGQKAKEGKDATVDKMGEYKDYTAEKAKEGKDTTTGKLAELRDSAAEAAKKAMGYLSGKKEEAKEGTAETMEGAKQRAWEAKEAAKEKTADTTEWAKQKASEMTQATKDKAAEATESAKQKTSEMAEATKDKAAVTKDKASDATERAKQKASELERRAKQRASDTADKTTEAAKQKTAEAKENLSAAEEETRRKMEEFRVKDNKEQLGDELSIKVKQSPPAGPVAVAEALKASDQMSGQTFNDVGSLDHEPQARVRVERRHK